MNNWKTEFEVKYDLRFTNDDGKEEIKRDFLIIEGCSKSAVINIIKHKFGYSEDLEIGEVTELWKY